MSHGVENYFPRLWDVGISDALFLSCISMNKLLSRNPHNWESVTSYFYVYMNINHLYSGKMLLRSCKMEEMITFCCSLI